MSVPNNEDPKPAIEIQTEGDAAFAALMDFMAPATDGAPADTGGGETQAPAAGVGQSAAPGEAAGADAGASQPGGTGTAGGEPVPPAWAAPAAAAAQPGNGPAAGAVEGVDFETIKPKFAEMSVNLEKATTQIHQEVALKAVREEFPEYFEALEKHPRLLVGMSVPKPDGEGHETLRDTQDARDWQEATKQVILNEIRGRAEEAAEQDRGVLEIVHASIELFQNNPDLVPGAKGFNKELADRLATLAKPYEQRVDGKLVGYGIDVQPLVAQLREQLKPAAPATAGQAAAPAPASAPAAPAVPPAAPKPPQAGIPSKPGSGSEEDDWQSILFGTLGMPDFRI